MSDSILLYNVSFICMEVSCDDACLSEIIITDDYFSLRIIIYQYPLDSIPFIIIAYYYIPSVI